MTAELTPTNNTGSLTVQAQIGQAANQAAAAAAFLEYQSRKADNTLRRQRAGLGLFASFLSSVGAQPGNLYEEPAAWHGITWGLVAAFTRWLLANGYTVQTVNVHLSTVKTYARLAFQVGTLSREEHAMIQAVKGFSRKEGKRIDARRETTRKGTKKAQPVTLTPEDIERMKAACNSNTAQGRRDLVIITLLAGLGLRVSELAGLTLGNLDPKERPELAAVYRPKVDVTQIHRLPDDARRALLHYLNMAPDWHTGDTTPLLYRTRKSGAAAPGGMSTTAIAKRVAHLGNLAGVSGLSPHDLRHYWATQAARAGVPVDALKDAGGWASPAMPLRYIEAAKIANDRVLAAIQ